MGSRWQRVVATVGSYTRCELGMSERVWVIVNITREEVPPTLLSLEGKLEGLGLSPSSRPVAPGRGLEGGRRIGTTPP